MVRGEVDELKALSRSKPCSMLIELAY